jgi:hypothetical protein
MAATKPKLSLLGTRRTIWSNFNEICKEKQMSQDAMTQLMQRLLGVECHVYENQLVIQGRFSSDHVATALSGEFVVLPWAKDKTSERQVNRVNPTVETLFSTLTMIISEIQPGERFQVLVPREYSHDTDGVDWDAMEELQMEYRGSILRSNVFVTLRFDQANEESEFRVDICCVTE